MPSRTDNDIKNRWNSIIRKHQHPGGRDWDPEENEARAQILGSASRTQSGKRSTYSVGRGDFDAAAERKRKKAAAVKRHYKRIRSQQLPKRMY